MTDAEDVLGAALGQDVRVRRDGNGVRAELRFDDLGRARIARQTASQALLTAS